MIIDRNIHSVCFTGHRDLTDDEIIIIKQRLVRLLINLADSHGLTDCYAGGAIGLDTVAAEAVLEIKELYPHIKLNLILPCVGQEKSWKPEQIDIYNQIQSRADKVRFLAPFYYNGCMQVRNRELLKNADICIAYLRKGTRSGGSLNTVLQAAKLNIPVINIADIESEDLI